MCKKLMAIVGLVLVVCAAWAAPPKVAAEVPKVVTTVGMITDIVRVVGGSDVVVEGLLPSGIDPHLYKPTREDLIAMRRADLVFYNGLLLEGKMTEAFQRVGKAGKPVVAVTEKLPESFLIPVSEKGKNFDPHVWMDPLAWKKAVEVVGEALGSVLPEKEALFEQRVTAFSAKLDQLHEYALRVLATVPEKSRVLITAHDAFEYFGKRYGFEIHGIQGISTESEAGVRDVERLVELLVARNVRAVFVETTVSERNIRALIEGAAAQDHEVRIGGELFSDAMGPEGSYEGTYLGMLDHNVTTISRALGGTAPARGFQGLLSRKGEGQVAG